MLKYVCIYMAVDFCGGITLKYNIAVSTYIYARMLPLRSRYRFDFVSLLTGPDSFLAPREVSSFITRASSPPIFILFVFVGASP